MSNMELRRAFLLGAVVCFGACGDPPKGRTYYERNIEPILLQTCAGNTSGCHVINDGDQFAIAAGNLDVSTFENVQKRRDALQAFGAYPYPLLLIKAVGPGKLQYQYRDTFRTLDVQHSGGGLIELGTDAFFTLQTWLDNGATENGLRPPSPAVAGFGDCSTELPLGFDPTPFRAAPGFATFRDTVQPILESHSCNAGACHGAPQSDFYITCGDTDDQLAFNLSRAWSFVNDPVDDSPLLRVPLGTNSGRTHSGGDQFLRTDEDFTELRAWAASVGTLDFAMGDPLKQFFVDNVQPIFIERGCSFEACHSPQANNDFKLRSGAVGFFGAAALQRNYDLFRDEFMALEFPDARRGRAVAKALLDDDPRLPVGVHGIAHRGGPVLETENVASDPLACPPFNPMLSTPFCTIQEWVTRERAALIAANQVQAMNPGDTVQVVFIERNANNVSADRLELDEIEGNATLKFVDVTLGPGQALTQVNPATAVELSGGAGCNLSGRDIRSPNVSPDGNRVIFAGRDTTAGSKLALFMATINPVSCQLFPTGKPTDAHDFDPVWSPDGNFIVFASTRGQNGVHNSRKRFLPQSDIWRIGVNGVAPMGTAEQMTFLSNSEVGPNFMREGRVTMTTEKVSTGFYQLAGRRINWDLTDYHPLLAQRKDSLFVDPTMTDLTTQNPSIGYNSATDIREAANGDFMIILADTDARGENVNKGGGALALFNRSIGPFEQGRGDVGYLQSVKFTGSGSANGRAPATAAYRRPFSLPDGQIMVTFAQNLGVGNWDIFIVNPRTNTQDTLFNPAGGPVRTDAVLAYRKPLGKLYSNRRQLIFGGSVNGADDLSSELHMPDAPMVFTVLVANLRRGRPLEAFDRATHLAIFRENACGLGCAPGPNGHFEDRTLLGTVPLASDGSIKVSLPSMTGVVFELRNGAEVIATMGEEHQLGPGERVSMGVSRTLFNGVCGGCHGSISGRELDVAVTPDALTGASASVSQTQSSLTPQ